MKKILKTTILLILSFSFITNTSFAEVGEMCFDDEIVVKVTEEVPGANCDESDGKIYCCVEPGFGSITKMMGAIIKYFTYIAGLGAVLFIVINGIMYSMSGMNDSMKGEAKERITKTLIGLILLLLSGVILNIVAPWIYV